MIPLHFKSRISNVYKKPQGKGHISTPKVLQLVTTQSPLLRTRRNARNPNPLYALLHNFRTPRGVGSASEEFGAHTNPSVIPSPSELPVVGSPRSEEPSSGMNKDRHRKQPPRLALLLLLLVLPAFSRAQTPPPPSQSTATDVVMLSLQALDPRAPSSQHVSEGLLGNSDMDLEVEKQLREIQMNIVRATAPFGPVLLLAPDETTKTAVYQRCKEFQICELFKTDRVRIKVVPHDGAWIRDFGPQIDAGGDSPYVVHWRYFDIRKEEAKREKFQEIETARLKLLEARHQEEQQDDFSQESSPEARKAVLSAIDAKLNLLREYSQILTEASVQRSNDENSAYDIADAVLAAPDFNFKSSPVALDGGNLLRLDDGRCLTTRVLLTRNKDQNVNLDQELEKIGGCKNVTYLEPLPGPVTEHIDMFALPVGGKQILLASYDLSKALRGGILESIEQRGTRFGLERRARHGRKRRTAHPSRLRSPAPSLRHFPESPRTATSTIQRY